MSHSWSAQGTYVVRAKAKDVNGAESGWSSSHEIVIRATLLEVDLLLWILASWGKDRPER
ncbi:hypothetical protein E3J48_03235 [Candidatus Aerophobetes bacterium]|uniref:PKD domain-containing protein n=1 Tax=Aerophobetes bacterium TaxID=2030807 RepID=A0A523W7M4_UNCAE|nr:MAG: hypothetical protein E3J48_03235 [Candidatus Aerophobetes bacterium]